MFPRSIYQPATLPKLNFLHPYDLLGQLAEFWRHILWRGRQKCEENEMMAASYDIEFSWQESFHKSTRPRLSKSSDSCSLRAMKDWHVVTAWQLFIVTPTARNNSVLPASEHWNYADRRAVLYSSRIRKLSGKTNWHRWSCKTMQIRKFSIRFGWVDCRRTSLDRRCRCRL